MHVFIDFASLWLPKMQSKSTIFPTIFENVDFVKIVLPSRRELNFQGFNGAFQKQLKVDAKSDIEKNLPNHHPKIILGLHFGLQKLP